MSAHIAPPTTRGGTSSSRRQSRANASVPNLGLSPATFHRTSRWKKTWTREGHLRLLKWVQEEEEQTNDLNPDQIVRLCNADKDTRFKASQLRNNPEALRQFFEELPQRPSVQIRVQPRSEMRTELEPTNPNALNRAPEGNSDVPMPGANLPNGTTHSSNAPPASVKDAMDVDASLAYPQ